MSFFNFLLHCTVASGLLASSVFAAKDDSGKDPCFAGDTVRLTGGETNSTCSTVVGRVEVCEEGEWRNLCDSNWTVQDAAVTCRSLSYSGQNAENQKDTGQIASGSSLYALKCNGSETNITDCDSVMENDDPNQRCSAAFLVLCYLTDEAAEERLCEAPVSELTTTLSLSTTGSGDTGMPTTLGRASPSTQTETDPTPAGTTEATTQTSPPVVTESTSFFVAPAFIGSLSAILLAAIIILLLLLICCCYWCSKGLLRGDTKSEQPSLQPVYETINSLTDVHCNPTCAQDQTNKCGNPAYNCSPNPAYSLVTMNNKHSTKTDTESEAVRVTPAFSIIAPHESQDSTYYEVIPD